MSKNIVVLADGTGQEGGVGQPTNIYKLFNLILDRSKKQVAFYDRGLGTGWRRVTGSIGGSGISKNIKECYRFIFEEFESGDEIFLFGFSRGAATVRSLSGFIHMFGILPKSRPELIRQAYRIYRIRDRAEREMTAKAFVNRHHTMWASIQFLGAWDTVAALGLPFPSANVILDRIPFWRNTFHDFRLSQSVRNGYHALSIDDERRSFHPVLWDQETHPGQNMHQVWFMGMHTDVGGGYESSGLSDVALEWMVEKATAHGLRVYHKVKAKCRPDPDGFMHDSRDKGWKKLFRREPRSWDHAIRGAPVVHESVLLRTKSSENRIDAPYRPWIFDGGVEPKVERWVHPRHWKKCPEGLEAWCEPSDPRAEATCEETSRATGS